MLKRALILLILGRAFDGFCLQDSLEKARQAALSGISAAQLKARIESENILNADTYAEAEGIDPYRARVVVTKAEPQKDGSIRQVNRVQQDTRPFVIEYQPGHPAADKKTGLVKKTNVDRTLAMVNLKESMLQMRALAEVLRNIKEMRQQTIDMIRG